MQAWPKPNTESYVHKVTLLFQKYTNVPVLCFNVYCIWSCMPLKCCLKCMIIMALSSFKKIARIYYCLRNFSSAFLHTFNKNVICNNWLENYRKNIYWYQPFLCKPKANLRTTLPLSESTRCANTWVWYVKFMLCFSIVIIPFSQSLCQYMLLHQYSIPLINFSINIQTREHKSQINAIPSPSVYR